MYGEHNNKKHKVARFVVQRVHQLVKLMAIQSSKQVGKLRLINSSELKITEG